MRKGSLLFLFIIILFSKSYSQSFKEKINTIYSFKIADLTAVEMENKYKQLDAFWQELSADTSIYLPMVRKELQTSGYSSYFYFDMSSYLEMQSPKDSDKRIIEHALKNIQWAELGTWELIEKMRDFSLNGIDISDIALQLLKQEKVKLVNPETQESFNQGKILVYLLLPSKNELYLRRLDAVFSSTSPESQRSIITLFWMTNTTFGKSKLEAISKNPVGSTLTIDVRSYADRLLRRFSPTEEELKPYVDLFADKEKQKQVLITGYVDALLNWNNQSWDNLISYSKLMHYFDLKIGE